MKKQTSVDWLKEMLIDNKYLSKDAEHLFEEAKAMHQEQIKETAIHFFPTSLKKENFEHYYNETYNNDRSNSSTMAS